jgi:hypothetical protein
MPDFNVRSDSVNVEQIMEQIRARIREKRGTDYTEQQIRELAAVKLEKFLDPRGVRSDLLEQFRKAQPPYEPPQMPNYAFEDATLFDSHRAPIRWMRKLLQPILKLFFNPNPLIQALNIQARLNTMNAEREARREATRRQMDQLYYELIHNLVIETTRLGIEVKNLKMRLESVSSRLEFNERRARALESAVVYKSDGRDETREPRESRDSRDSRGQQQQQQRYQQQQPQRPYSPPPQPQPAAPPSQPPAPSGEGGAAQPAGQMQPQQGSGLPGEGPGQRSRRRRRRRGRRGGGSAAGMMGGHNPQGQPGAPDQAPQQSAAPAHVPEPADASTGSEQGDEIEDGPDEDPGDPSTGSGEGGPSGQGPDSTPQ